MHYLIAVLLSDKLSTSSTMKTFLTLPLLLAVSAFSPPSRFASAQFTCTLSATDEDSCLDAKDDDGEHCVWCSLSSFGFCLNEAAAEAAEQSLPGVSCDRHKKPDADDDEPAPSGDDDSVPPSGDDDVKPTDDSLPDDYWKCLKKKDSATCDAEADCVWCESKIGWGVCMSGPSADSAAESDFFTCDSKVVPTQPPSPPTPPPVAAGVGGYVSSFFGGGEGGGGPYDSSCIQAYLKDQTQDACVATTDADGSACKWCSLAGMTNMCLTPEQADMGSSLGITCDGDEEEEDFGDEDAIAEEGGEEAGDGLDDPLDPSCVVAFLENPTKESCTGTTDQDGNACEWCSFQAYDLCLTAEQAAMGEQAGVSCDAAFAKLKKDEEGGASAVERKYVRG